MLTVEIQNTKEIVCYVVVEQINEVPGYINQNLDLEKGPYKYKSVPIYQTNFKCEFIYLDDDKKIRDVNFGELPYKSIHQIVVSNLTQTDHQTNQMMTEIVQGKKHLIMKKSGNVCLVINPFGA